MFHQHCFSILAIDKGDTIELESIPFIERVYRGIEF